MKLLDCMSETKRFYYESDIQQNYSKLGKKKNLKQFIRFYYLALSLANTLSINILLEVNVANVQAKPKLAKSMVDHALPPWCRN